MDKNFWLIKSPENFSNEEWEAICTHCGKCCVTKLKRDNTIMFTNIICKHLKVNDKKCCCSVYDNRHKVQHNCAKVDLKLIKEQPEILPNDCAYKLLVYQHILPNWHPLVTGDMESPVKAGKTICSHLVVKQSLFSLFKLSKIKILNIVRII